MDVRAIAAKATGMRPSSSDNVLALLPVSVLCLVAGALAGCKSPSERRDKPVAAVSAEVPTGSSAAPGPSTDRLTLVKSAAAPLLPEVEGGERAAQVVHLGDLLYVVGDLPPLAWKAKMGGMLATREGPMVEVTRAAGDTRLYGFRVDLGDEITVPSATSLCMRLSAALPAITPASRDACPKFLRRARMADGALLAYENCSTGPCPVGVLRGNALGAITVDGIVDSQLVYVAGKPLLLANARWVKEAGTWTGGFLVSIALDGATPSVSARIPTDDIDARDPVLVVQRNVTVDIGPEDVHLTGELRTVDRNTGHVQKKAPIDERHPLVGPKP